MSESGFSIKCPHCHRWTDSSLDPVEVVIESEDEFRQILSELEDEPNTFFNRKRITCKQPPWKCPAPFEAFVCKTEKEAKALAGIPKAWAFPRTFRLLKHNRTDYWDNFVGLLFCSQQLHRNRHIILSRLIEEELLRKTLVGVAVEIGAPVTAYVASVYEKNGKECLTHWLPIEQYTTQRQIVPPGYNPLCHICRKMEVSKTMHLFAAANVAPNNCPIALGFKGTCGSLDAACIQDNWDKCPAFLAERGKMGMCLHSDVELIRLAIEEWEKGEDKGWTTRTCWAGFTDIAAPIVIHGVLVGVLMTGQFLTNPEALLTGTNMIKKAGASGFDAQEIDRYLSILRGEMPRNQKEKDLATLKIAPHAVDKIGENLRENARLVARTAEEAYLNFRRGSEMLFKLEVLSKLEAQQKTVKFETKIGSVLDRLKEFWGFKAVALLGAHISDTPTDNDLNLSLFMICNQNGKSHVFPNGLPLGHINVPLSSLNSTSFLFDRKNRTPPSNPYGKKLYEIIDQALGNNLLKVPVGRCYFTVAARADDYYYTLLFAVRDEQASTTLPMHDRGMLSNIAREFIFDTSVGILQALGRPEEKGSSY